MLSSSKNWLLIVFRSGSRHGVVRFIALCAGTSLPITHEGFTLSEGYLAATIYEPASGSADRIRSSSGDAAKSFHIAA